MINLLEEIDKIKVTGYNEANAEARLCQDIILYGIANGSLSRNVTIKGGVVMRNISKDARRATQDIDLDFIKHSISNESIKEFVRRLQITEDLSIELREPIIELNHQDYKGKRIFIVIKDSFGNRLESKVDVGVHKELDIEQEEYCFDICFQEDGVSLLMNSREQIITEKLKSFLRFGIRTTRYKDVFDICYLSENVNRERLLYCIKKYIYNDSSLRVNNPEDILTRITRVFNNKQFLRDVDKSKKNWINITTDEAAKRILDFIKTILL